jgi:hypothetical protein
MTKGDNGVWEIIIGPIASGSCRYNFNVNGVAVIDPRNPLVSESKNVCIDRRAAISMQLRENAQINYSI